MKSKRYYIENINEDKFRFMFEFILKEIVPFILGITIISLVAGISIWIVCNY